MIEVVIMCIFMVLLRQTLVEGVQGDVGTVQTYTLYNTRNKLLREKSLS